MDMNEIEAIFFQECEEGLVGLEACFAELSGGGRDPETINTIFRHVHSIKGGAGAFGLERLQPYPAATVEPVPAPLAKVWLKQHGTGFQVDPMLREALTINALNLLGEWPIRTKFDAIFCRNVMIYFDGPTKARLQTRLAERLETGGLLCIGHSERLDSSVAGQFESVGRTSFRKIA